MPVVELIGDILALSIEVLVGVILAQPLKATSREKTTRPGSHGVVASRKLYRLAGPAHLGVLALVEKLRDAEVEIGGPRPVDVGSQRSKCQRGPESESGGLRPAGSGPKLEDK